MLLDNAESKKQMQRSIMAMVRNAQRKYNVNFGKLPTTTMLHEDELAQVIQISFSAGRRFQHARQTKND